MAEITLDSLIIPKYDDVLFDIMEHKHKHYCFYSGRGSTKSSFIAIAIILLMIEEKNRNTHVVVFRKVSNTLKDSVYDTLLFAISLLGLDAAFKRTASPMKIIYIKTGQTILFRGLDDPGKIKSIKAPFGYFGITWFEELDQYHGRGEIRSVLQSTMRGMGGVFWNFESLNPPISRENWTNKDILIYQPDRLVIKSSYLDVPREWLSEDFCNYAEHKNNGRSEAFRRRAKSVLSDNSISAHEIPQKFPSLLVTSRRWAFYPSKISAKRVLRACLISFCRSICESDFPPFQGNDDDVCSKSTLGEVDAETQKYRPQRQGEKMLNRLLNTP